MILTKLLFVFVIGYVTLGLWMGIRVSIALCLNKMKIKYTGNFLGFLAAIIPTALILFLSQNAYFHLSGFLSLKAWFSMMIAAVAASVIVSFGKKGMKQKAGKLVAECFDGIVIEVPMRWMMQTFLTYLSVKFRIPYAAYWAIPVNALVWCMGIITQNAIGKQPMKDILRDVMASFVFSIFIGYAYTESALILIPMIGHFLERIISNQLKICE